MPRSLAAVLVTATIALLTAVSAAGATSSTSIHPYQGRYLGHDSHGHGVSMYFHTDKVVHFEVDHVSTNFPEATVSGHQFHHTCNSHGYCIRGQWTHDHEVTGTWNNSKTGHSGTFTVNAIAT